MVSEKFLINRDTFKQETRDNIAEAFIRLTGLEGREALRLRLLVEETLGMISATVDDFYGRMWLDGDNKQYRIHLEATADLDARKRRELLSVSSTGRNASTVGLMAKIGEVWSALTHGAGKAVKAYGELQYGSARSGPVEDSVMDLVPVWTLTDYRDQLQQHSEEGEDAAEAFDELEKSIVANVADDVIVGVKGDQIEMIIIRRMD